ncbi:hypothetical protein GH714_014904 [Hevea brasiliensis]|uniref:Uncharacterized protein n=1 Tax=Hevea brasiliensis TaxID=3981 RepID=A0A6A6K6P9_HEVBR|nr:hypothetical protein GH714_014904 [Hevea brasiliensis]
MSASTTASGKASSAPRVASFASSSKLSALDRLSSLRLEWNRFYGSLPPLNQSFLIFFNVSVNNLTGPIPVTPTLSKFHTSSFSLNPDLCGEIINKECTRANTTNSKEKQPAAAASATEAANSIHTNSTADDQAIKEYGEVVVYSKTKEIEVQQVRRAEKSGGLVFCGGQTQMYTLEQLMRASAELLGRNDRDYV